VVTVIPASLTVSAMLSDAQSVVTEFDGLILLVAGLAVGVWAVRFLIRRVQNLT